MGGITSREDYIELRDASREAENVFLSKLQGTLRKNLTGLCKNVRDMVVKRHGRLKENILYRDPVP